MHVDHDLGSLEGIKPSQMKGITASASDRVRIKENGVKFEVDFAAGHKTGFFCDQRDNRKRFGSLAAGARVLDLCSYTGGFSINAEGMRKYADLNTIAARIVKPGGLLVTCACSGLVSLETFEECVIKGVHRLNRRLQLFDRTGPGVDHPAYPNCLESRYLKVLWARVV